MRRFAQDCKGFTGDSIVQTINAALEKLIREFKSATHFRPVSIGERQMYCSCDAGVQGAVKRRYEDFQQLGSADKITTRELTADLLQASTVYFKAEVRASEAADAKHRVWSSNQYYQ